MPRFGTLDEWLAWQEGLHPRAIDLGLERVAGVAAQLGLSAPAWPVITVAGTNGKGSSIALLEAIYRSAGYRTAVYTSPHLLHYSERVRIDGVPAAGAALCAAFERIDRARGSTSLTYFEFGTLAALLLFEDARPDVALLEVGMGGRLDAVNIVDPDVALVTAIGIDHSEWLGTDREAIGREKAGILRTGRPAVCSDPHPPDSLRTHADAIGARWHGLGEDFSHRRDDATWSWRGRDGSLAGLPLPALTGAHQLDNAAGVLAVIRLLAGRLPVARAAIDAGLRSVRLAGRFQVIGAGPQVVLDVAHNPDAAHELARQLRSVPVDGRTWLVLGMLADKDAAAFAAALDGVIDCWCLAGLAGARGLPAAALAQRVAGVTGEIGQFDSVAAALAHAREAAGPDDRIVVCGSFLTVAQALDTTRPVAASR